MKKRILAYFLALLLPLCMLAGCSEQLPLVYVQSVAELVGYGSIGAYNACAGVVMAQEEIRVERDESRPIKALSVEVGQVVNEGDVLFIYDNGNVDLEIDRLTLEIEQLKNTINDLKKQIAQLEKEKKAAKDDDKLAYTLQIQSLQTDQAEAEYNQKLKQREIEALKSGKDTGEVKSPISGEVKAINKDGGYDNFTGMPLPYITLVSKDVFRIKGTVNELNREEFYVGQNVVIRSRVDTSQTWTGVITSMDTQAEENNDFYYGVTDDMYASSSYPFYVQPNSNEGLLLGQHVFIEPDYGQTLIDGGLHLNAAYVCGNEEDGFYVWAADENDKIEKRSVTVGTLDKDLYTYEILEGLTTLDRIAYPSDEIIAGAPITEVLPGQDESVEEDTQISDFDDNVMIPADTDIQPVPAVTEGELLPAENDLLPEIVDDGGSV